MRNLVMIQGYLGADPTVRYTPSGEPIARLRIATTRKWTDRESGEKREATEWHSVSVSGKKTVENFVVPFLKQGALVDVTGSLRTHQYEKNGERRFSTEIRADDVQLLDRKPKDLGVPPADDDETLPL